MSKSFWYEVDDCTLWHNAGNHRRWIAENSEGVSTLYRVTGYGAEFESVPIVTFDESTLRADTVAAFRSAIEDI